MIEVALSIALSSQHARLGEFAVGDTEPARRQPSDRLDRVRGQDHPALRPSGSPAGPGGG